MAGAAGRGGIRNIEPVTIDPRGGVSVNRDIHPEYEVAPATEPVAEAPAPTAAAPEEAPAAPVEEQTNVTVPGQPGEAVRGGTREVPEGNKPEPAQESKPIRAARESSPFGGEPSVGNVRGANDEGEPKQRNAEPPISAEVGEVTKPPAINTGGSTARPDTPADTGVEEARTTVQKGTRSNYRITDADEISVGTPKQKIKANI